MSAYEERRENELERWESRNNGQTSNPEIWFEKGYDSGFADGVDLLPPITIEELAEKLYDSVHEYNEVNPGGGYTSRLHDDYGAAVDGGVMFLVLARIAFDELRGGKS